MRAVPPSSGKVSRSSRGCPQRGQPRAAHISRPLACRAPYSSPGDCSASGLARLADPDERLKEARHLPARPSDVPGLTFPSQAWHGTQADQSNSPAIPAPSPEEGRVVAGGRLRHAPLSSLCRSRRTGDARSRGIAQASEHGVPSVARDERAGECSERRLAGAAGTARVGRPGAPVAQVI